MGFDALDRFVIVLVPITAFVCTAAVLIFRPLAKRLGSVLGELQAQRATAASGEEVKRLQAQVERLSERLALVEGAVDFHAALRAPQPGSARELLPK